ncbi:MAG: hypothetical protein LBP32_03590 [Spirochaetaceae bacterium]|jgi:hypothetical protein|nr:hypothetical protein [Spirochaetaceae bacterium]
MIFTGLPRCFFPPLLLAALFLSARTPAGSEEPPPVPGAESPAELPRSFREIRLGMGLEELKAALQADEVFSFRGDRDVSFLPSREQSLVETTGFSFIRRAFFQLRDGELFIMAFSLDPSLVDHYSVFTTLVKKYGQPRTLDPQQAVWESGDTRVAIERPLTVKYIDMRVFKELAEESEVRESREIFLRQEFLDGF